MKTAWVTGSTGFWGRNVVLSLLRLNWRVVALSRQAPEDLAAWARSQGRELVWHHFDLQNPLDRQLADLPTPPQALFHCAATFDDHLDTMLTVNVLRPIALIESVLPQMQAIGEGRVGIFLGQNGRIGLPGIGHFSATQGAIWTWAESQSRALASRRDVSVSLVFPPRAPSSLQGQLAEKLKATPVVAPATQGNACGSSGNSRAQAQERKLSKQPQLSRRPTADSLVKGVLSGHRRVGRWPILAALSTIRF